MVKEQSIWHGIGFGIFLSIIVGTVLGWLGLGGGPIAAIILFFTAYIPTGYLVGYLNPNHPYTLSMIAGIILSFFNQLVIIFYLAPSILLSPLTLNLGILFGVLASLTGAVFAAKPWRQVRSEEL